MTMNRNNYQELDRQVFAALDAKATARTCSCGQHFAGVPERARFFADGEMSGWYWECSCNSTLFMPDKIIK